MVALLSGAECQLEDTNVVEVYLSIEIRVEGIQAILPAFRLHPSNLD